MADIKMTFRDKEILTNHPIIKNIVWWPMYFVTMAIILIAFTVVLILFPFLMIIHYVLCVITGGKVKLIGFIQ